MRGHVFLSTLPTDSDTRQLASAGFTLTYGLHAVIDREGQSLEFLSLQYLASFTCLAGK